MNVFESRGMAGQENCRNTMAVLAEYVQSVLDFNIDDMDEEAKGRLEKRILAKLEAGKRLTEKELRFLKRYNPQLYATAMRVEAKRKGVEERLKHAHSKNEVENILDEALASVSKKDSACQYLMAAVMDAVGEFKETEAYRKLPQTEQKKGRKSVQQENMGADATDKSSDKQKIKYEYVLGAYQTAYFEKV